MDWFKLFIMPNTMATRIAANKDNAQLGTGIKRDFLAFAFMTFLNKNTPLSCSSQVFFQLSLLLSVARLMRKDNFPGIVNFFIDKGPEEFYVQCLARTDVNYSIACSGQ